MKKPSPNRVPIKPNVKIMSCQKVALFSGISFLDFVFLALVYESRDLFHWLAIVRMMPTTINTTD